MPGYFAKALRAVTYLPRTAAAQEASGRFAWSLLLVDLVIGSFACSVADGYWLERRLDAESIATLSGCLVLVYLLGLAYTDRWLASRGGNILKLAATNLLATIILPVALRRFGIEMGRRDAALILVIAAPLQVTAHLAHRRWRLARPYEILRWALVGMGALSVGYPLLTNRTLGTGDAYWYGLMVGDFVTQWREGIFPVFVGQSDYAFNGAVSPLRFAPYLQHAAGVLDLLTLRTLPFPGLLNLTLFSSLVAAAFTSYASLAATGTGARWAAAALALIFISSPGVLSLIYNGDLFMSLCAVPYVPLAFYGIWRTFQHRDRSGICLLSAALAALWLCHPPIAFWTGIVAALSQLIRLAREYRDKAAWRGWFTGLALFFALSAFAFISVLTLKLPAAVADTVYIVQYTRDVFPDIFLPVSEYANSLSDFQLGWTLWVLLLTGAVFAGIRRRGFNLSLALATVGLLLLLLPVPRLSATLWQHLPQVVINITNHWPMQRFYVLLGAMAVFLAYGWIDRLWSARGWLPPVLIAMLLGGLWWSEFQAGYFLERSVAITASSAAGKLAQQPQNRVLTRYAYSPFPQMPPYFSHGYVDPALENRLLSPGTLKEVDSNKSAVLGAAGSVRTEGSMEGRAYDGQSVSFELINPLRIEPRRHYALVFDFARPDLTGSLLISGSTVAREYYLPDSAAGQTLPVPPTSFGARPSSTHFVSLWSTSPKTEDLLVQFVAKDPPGGSVSTFGRYSLREYDVTRLPIAVETWVPYRARVTSSAPALVETPRLYVDGYAATVNGRAAPATRSPAGLVMIPVPAGTSRVTLNYPGPLLLRGAYYFTLAAWLVFIVMGIRSVCRRCRPVAAS